MNHTDTRSLLLEQILEDDEDARYEAAGTLAVTYRPPFADVLAWTEDTRPRMREMACYILGCTASAPDTPTKSEQIYPEAVPTLLERLEDTDEQVRLAAAGALGHHHAPESIPTLLRFVADPSEEMRYMIAFALGGTFGEWEGANRVYKPLVEQALLRLMDDADDDVRDWATFAIHLGEHDTPQTHARLWQALDDPNYDVRGEAAEGLAKFGDRSLIPRLQTLLADPDQLSPCFFLAARELGDPVLLPAVLDAARRWREWGLDNDWFIEPAIEALQKKQAEISADAFRKKAEQKT
jgi:HEAT repeats